MQGRRLRPAIGQGDLDQHVAGCSLGVFDEHVEIAVFVKDAGIEQFIFRFVAAAPPIGFD